MVGCWRYYIISLSFWSGWWWKSRLDVWGSPVWTAHSPFLPYWGQFSLPYLTCHSYRGSFFARVNSKQTLQIENCVHSHPSIWNYPKSPGVLRMAKLHQAPSPKYTKAPKYIPKYNMSFKYWSVHKSVAHTANISVSLFCDQIIGQPARCLSRFDDSMHLSQSHINMSASAVQSHPNHHHHCQHFHCNFHHCY